MAAKKCTKTRDARAELLFCQSKSTAFTRSRSRRRRRCLSSLKLPREGGWSRGAVQSLLTCYIKNRVFRKSFDRFESNRTKLYLKEFIFF